MRLEPLSAEHHDGLRDAAAPPEIWDYWSFNAGESDAAFDAWFERCIDEAGGGGDSHFATILQSTGQPVGSTSFCTIREEDRGMEIGWTWLTPGGLGHGRQH